MARQFTGTLILEDDRAIDATVTIGEEILSISAAGGSVGDWPLKYCRVAFEGQSVYSLWVDGDRASFTPSDPRAFGLTAAKHFQASVLADRIEVMRSAAEPVPVDEPVAAPTRDSNGEAGSVWYSQRRVPVGAGLAVVGFITLVTMATLGDLPEPPADVTTPTEPPTTVVATTVQGPLPAIATVDPEGFQRLWNSAAVSLGTPQLTLDGFAPDGLVATVTEAVTVQLTLGNDGLVDLVTMTVDPSGDSASDATAIQAMGIGVAVSDPELSGSSRRQLMGELGLDIAAPQLDGLDGYAESGGIAYGLQYVAGPNQLVFVMGII